MKTDKFSPRAEACVLMGYSTTQKGYILYSLHQRKLIVNRDVVSQEHVFPFHSKSSDYAHVQLFSPNPPGNSSSIEDTATHSEEIQASSPVFVNNDVHTMVKGNELHINHDPIEEDGDIADLQPAIPEDNALAEGNVGNVDLQPVIPEENVVNIVPAGQSRSYIHSTRTSHPPIWMKDYVAPL